MQSEPDINYMSSAFVLVQIYLSLLMMTILRTVLMMILQTVTWCNMSVSIMLHQVCYLYL